MTSFGHAFSHFKRYGMKHKPLYILSIMFLFWTIFDGLMSYMAPLVVTEAGLSKTLMGIIIGSSSIAGAIFDIFLCRYLKDTKFRRVYIMMFALCFVFPLILWQAHASIWIYLIAMIIWGFYYDLQGFGNFDFIARYMPKKEHSSGFGVLQVFHSVGYLLAPIIAGVVIGEVVGPTPFVMSWVFLSIATVFLIMLLIMMRGKKEIGHVDKRIKKHKINLFIEMSIWRRVGVLILPVLILTTMLNVIDSFFWTIGPLVAESLSSLGGFRGLFMVAYSLPPLIVGWFVGLATHNFGKKRTAIFCLLMGSALMIFFSFSSATWLLISSVFVASCFMSIAWPSVNGAYADYITDCPLVEKEVEGVIDFSSNIGYIIGPMLAGIIADRAGNLEAFTFLGIFGVMLALVLFRVTPRSIKITEAVAKV